MDLISSNILQAIACWLLAAALILMIRFVKKTHGHYPEHRAVLGSMGAAAIFTVFIINYWGFDLSTVPGMLGSIGKLVIAATGVGGLYLSVTRLARARQRRNADPMMDH